MSLWKCKEGVPDDSDTFRNYNAPPLTKLVDLPREQAYDPEGFEERIQQILESLSKRLAQINYTFKKLIKNNENVLYANNGLISSDNLFRLLYKLRAHVKPKDQELLVMKYGAGGGCFLNIDILEEDMAKAAYRTKHCLKRNSMVRRHENLGDDEMYAPDYHFSFGCRQDSQRWRSNINKESFNKSITRIREYIYRDNVQLQLFFSQYDKMNHGKLKKCNFLRSLENAGISETKNIRCGLHMRNDELSNIADVYTDGQDKELVHWRKFVNDIEDVHGPVNLMKMGRVKMEYFSPSPDVRRLDFRLAGQSLCTPQEMDESSKIMKSISHKIIELRVDPLPFFRQYDKNRTGYVDLVQFLKAMHQAKIYLTYAEGNSVGKVFSNIQGFRYERFLTCLGAYENLPGNRKVWLKDDKDSVSTLSSSTSNTLKELIESDATKRGAPERLFDTEHTRSSNRTCQDYTQKIDETFIKPPYKESIEKQIERIQNEERSVESLPPECKVVHLKEAINIIKYYCSILRVDVGQFFEQYDRLKTGYYSEENFARALRSAYDFPLSQLHYLLLFDRYRHPFQTDLINGKEFLNDIEKIEGDLGYGVPYLRPVLPGRSAQPRRFTREEVDQLEDIWKRIARNVKEFKEWEICKTELKSPFDSTKSSLVTKERYLKVLEQIHILPVLSEKDLHLIYNTYAYDTGAELKFDLYTFFKHLIQMCHKYRLYQ